MRFPKNSVRRRRSSSLIEYVNRSGSLGSAAVKPPFIMNSSKPKNTICLWYNNEALEAAQFYAATFPDSKVTSVFHAPSDYPSGKAGDVLTVEFTVAGIP